MIARTLQEIADFFGMYLVRDIDGGELKMFDGKPTKTRFGWQAMVGVRQVYSLAQTMDYYTFISVKADELVEPADEGRPLKVYAGTR